MSSKQKYIGPRVHDTETFIKKSVWMHGGKYDYSATSYMGSDNTVKIICPTHGIFEQRAANHLQGKGCRKCQYEGNSGTLRYSTEDFISKSKEIHGDKYDYSFVEYKTKEDKVKIVCPDHGNFWQRAGSHMQGRGCRSCKYVMHVEQKSISSEDILRRCKEVHGDKYIYPYQKLNGMKDKVQIVCRRHGSFHQYASNHIRLGHGCPKCKGEQHALRSSLNTQEFIKRATAIHGDYYNYSDVQYINNHGKISIKCPEHGDFFQSPDSHLQGSGCYECSKIRVAESHRYNNEIFVEKALSVHGSHYNYDHVEYIGSFTKIDVCCTQHGVFQITPSAHLFGQGCPECANLRKGFGRSPIYRSFEEYSHIYFTRLCNSSEEFLKIGLARKPSVRHARIQRDSDYKIEVLRCHKASGVSVYDIEKYILSNKELVKYVPEQMFQGYTECFSLESYEDIDEILEVCFDI